MVRIYFVVFVFFTTLPCNASGYQKEYGHSNGDKCIKIALEGMPGAGKTSTLLDMVSKLEGSCVVLSELLPEPYADWGTLPLEKQTRIYHDLWVLRMKAAERLSHYTPCFFFDRTYFTSLAFTYATEKFFKNKKYLHEAHDKKRYANELPYDGAYARQKKLTLKDLGKEHFDLIIFLDVMPKTGLNRRNKINDTIPWLSSETVWLDFYREFYHKEFSKFHKGKALYIDTEELSLDETIQKITDYLIKELNVAVHSRKVQKSGSDEQIEEKILSYGKNYNLGKYRSSILSVYGYPTIYYRKHSLQFVDGSIRWFNNYQLNAIAKQFEEQEFRMP